MVHPGNKKPSNSDKSGKAIEPFSNLMLVRMSIYIARERVEQIKKANEIKEDKFFDSNKESPNID